MTLSMHRIIPRRIIQLCLLACALAVTGCSDRNAGRVRVSGTVDFAGTPVPTAQIYFEPDPAKGGKGPTGYAIVRSGSFDTAAVDGRGAVAGPMLVRIDGGHDPAENRMSGGEAEPRMWFRDYRTTVELPAGPSVHRFSVPATSSPASSRK
jgi:hypothetical protein